MRALVFHDGAPREVNRPEPRPGPGEARIRVLLAGICRTDLEIAKGYMGHRGIAGHEFVGVVESSPTPGLVGRRVVGEINAPCRDCDTCRAGRPRHCPRRSVLGIAGRDGAFAEFLTLPDENLHPVPDLLPDRAAIWVEPLAAAYEILEQVSVDTDTKAAIVGDGKLAYLCALVLMRRGISPEILGKHGGNLRRFRECRLRTRESPRAVDRVFDLVVEASGSPSGFELALRAVRPCGTIVLKSTYQGAAPMDLAPVVIDEIRVVGSRCGPFPPALIHATADASRFESMVTRVMPLGDAGEAFRCAAIDATSKIVLDPRR